MYKYLFNSKKISFLFLIITPIAVVIDVGLALLMKIIVDAGVSGDLRKLKLIIVISIFYSLFNIGVDILWHYLCGKLLQNATLGLKEDLLSGILRQNIDKFNKKNTSNYISLFTDSIRHYENEYFFNLCYTYRELLSFIISTISIILINPIIAITIIFLGFVQLAIPNIFTGKIQEKRKFYSNNLKTYSIYINYILIEYSCKVFFQKIINIG